MTRGDSHSESRPEHARDQSREIERAFAAMGAMDPRYKICYLLPHADQDDATTSVFGWYTEGLHEAAGPLQLAATLPADIREPYAPASAVLARRLLRHVWPAILPVQVSSLSEAIASVIPTPFQVVLTNRPDVAQAVDHILASHQSPALHASAIPAPGRVSIETLDAQRIDQFARSVLGVLCLDPRWSGFARNARQVMSGSKRRNATKHHLPRGLHNVTMPNELALTAFGWKLTKVSRISEPLVIGPGDPKRYISHICASADAVAHERSRLVPSGAAALIDYRYILAVSSVYWGHYDKWRKLVQGAAPGARRRLKQIYASVVQASTYYDRITVEGDAEEALRSLRGEITRQRAADMASFTSVLSALSCATLAPVLRLEPRLNEVRGELKLLAHCVRTEARSNLAWKASRLTRRIGERLRMLVDEEFLARIDVPERDGEIEGMKLVCDVPLELMLSGGIPLCMRFDVSRQPPVPGNLFMGQCLVSPVILPMSLFSEVLVVRSFAAGDVLRNMFESAVAVVQQGEEVGEAKVAYRFVDVSTPDEFVAALQSYGGAVLVFDGHGTYDSQTGVGTLVIGGEPLDVWALRSRCHVPPIVMFSACDTQPIDGSHGSVANAVFNLGARAVLATLFPIYGDKAALFNARMLYRLKAFIPAALKIRPFLTWREVVSGMLRMSYAYEVLRALADLARVPLSEAEIRRIQLKANVAINARQADWHTVLMEAIADATALPMVELAHKVGQWVGLTDSLKYVQLGSPENIIIVREHPGSILERIGKPGNEATTSGLL